MIGAQQREAHSFAVGAPLIGLFQIGIAESVGHFCQPADSLVQKVFHLLPS